MNGDTTHDKTTCTIGDNLNIPAIQPTKYGYDFVGWHVKAAHELEYLTVLRGAYIDTGIVFDTNEIEFDIKFTYTYTGSYARYVFGAGGTGYYGLNSNGYGLFEWGNGGTLDFGYGGVNDRLNLAPKSTEIYTCNMKISGRIISGKCDDYEAKSLRVTQAVSIPNTIYLGSKNSEGYSLGGGTDIYYGGSLYYFKIKKDGELVRDFIPVLAPDGIVCFYDKVTKQFFYNAGAADFVAGPVKE